MLSAPGPDRPTIAAGFAKGLLMFAVSRGADRQTLLDRAGLASKDLAEQDAHVPLSAYVSLFEAAAEACGEPAMALKFGEAVRMQDLSIVGLICEVAETTADVGRQLNRYARLVVDEGRPADIVAARPSAEGLWLDVVSPAYASSPYMLEAELARLVCNTRASFAALPEFRAMRFPWAVHFTHARPPYAAEHERVFKAPVVFGAGRNALLCDPAFALLRQPPTDFVVFRTLTKRADLLLRGIEASNSLRSRVEETLISVLHEGEVGVDLVARRLGLGRRTLQRRLRAEGVTFETVLDELRCALARRYLGDGKVSANETAYLLGFSEPAAFSRAFRRWTGVSPGAFRSGTS